MGQITGHTGFLGLLGNPVKHSVSPLMHNESFKKLGLDYVYLCFEADEETLPAVVAGLKACKIKGFNLTMPCKNKIVELLDELSPAAALIGAVNTVVNDEGRLIGYNTDGIGFMQSARDAGYEPAGQVMTVMGAGGAATAICAQAAIDGVKELHIFARPQSRFHERTVQLVENINASYACRAYLHDHADKEALKNAVDKSYMLVNATSVGMAPHVDQSIISDPAVFRKDLIVADIIYNPQETQFLKLAGSCGCRTFNGTYMCLYQGAAAFKLWMGVDMPVEYIKKTFF